MKQWLRTLWELSKWERSADPSAPELAREMNRFPEALCRELRELRVRGLVKRIEPNRPDKIGLRNRWRITEKGKNRLRREGINV